MEVEAERNGRFFGRRRQVPLYVLFGGFALARALNASTVTGVLFALFAAASCDALAWRYWRQPIPPPAEARRARERAAGFGSHPVRSAALGALGVTVSLVSGFLPRYDLAAVAPFSAIAGGLIGIGLYFVFRTDPQFHPNDEPDPA